MAFTYIKVVLPVEITFSEAEIVNSIQQVGLANAISAAYANDALGKLELLVKIILELENRYRMEKR